MTFLSRDQILQAQDRRFQEISVPEWGGTVRIGSLSALQHDRWLTATSKIDKANGVTAQSSRALLVAMSVVDEAGTPIFTEQDVEALSQRSSWLLDRLVEDIVRLNGLTKEQQKDQKAF